MIRSADTRIHGVGIVECVANLSVPEFDPAMYLTGIHEAQTGGWSRNGITIHHNRVGINCASPPAPDQGCRFLLGVWGCRRECDEGCCRYLSVLMFRNSRWVVFQTARTLAHLVRDLDSRVMKTLSHIMFRKACLTSLWPRSWRSTKPPIVNLS